VHAAHVLSSDDLAAALRISRAHLYGVIGEEAGR
jgi:hypothetical protein